MQGRNYLIILCLLLASCYGPKQAKKQVDRAILEQPGTAAGELRKAFPCTELSKSDTTLITQDSLVYIDCPTDYFTAHDTLTKTDTLTRLINGGGTVKYIKVPVHIPVQTQIVTKYVHDNADDAVIKDLQINLSEQTLRAAKLKGKSDKWFWIAMGLLVIVGIGLYFKLKSVKLPFKS